jgi:hypothetical protein
MLKNDDAVTEKPKEDSRACELRRVYKEHFPMQLNKSVLLLCLCVF